MPAKKETKKKRTVLRETAAKKGPTVKKAAKKKLAKKKATPKKKLTRKKAVLNKVAVKKKVLVKKTASPKTAGALKKRVQRKNQSVDAEAFAAEGLRARSGGQSGDLQGLSSVEGVDSESVEELIEEGNAFEADAVMGVEHADDTDEKEVRTREVPEDDVPGEYLDKD
jgi:hypothetical protein